MDDFVFRKPDASDPIRPASRAQRSWPRNDRLGVIGACLSGAFPPCDGDFDDLLLALGDHPAGPKPVDSVG